MSQARATTTRDAPPALTPGYTGIAGASRYCGLSPRTLWRLIAGRKLRSFRVGGRVVLRVQDMGIE